MYFNTEDLLTTGSIVLSLFVWLSGLVLFRKFGRGGGECCTRSREGKTTDMIHLFARSS